MSLGALWAENPGETPAEPLDTAIIFTPVGALVPNARRAVRKDGRVVWGTIHMSHIPHLPYSIMWKERHLLRVASLTRQDAFEFHAIAPKIGIKTTTLVYLLEQGNAALADLRAGRFKGPGC